MALGVSVSAATSTLAGARALDRIARRRLRHPMGTVSMRIVRRREAPNLVPAWFQLTRNSGRAARFRPAHQPSESRALTSPYISVCGSRARC